MNYWLDLFTGTTWSEFQKFGATISGFSNRKRNIVQKIQPRDILLCYLTGVMRWVPERGLEILNAHEIDNKPEMLD
jgi:hypothetical protein